MMLLFGLFTTLLIAYGCSNGIYLMLGDECIANGTWFLDGDLQIAGGQDGYIHCVLPNETLNGGQWVRPNGLPVDCMNGATTSNGPYKEDPFFCTDDHPNANITLYLMNDDYFQPPLGLNGGGINIGIETEYKCCLPTNCSDPNTNIMTINVFERVYIIDVHVDPPSDITAIPQNYTVHCIVTGSFTEAIIKQYYTDSDSNTELSQSYCDNTYTGYSCTVNNTSITTYNTYDDTRDYTVTVEWEGESISNGIFRQSANNGDHVHLCTAASGTSIKPEHKGRSESITVRAPSSSPTNVSIIDVTLTSITIQWSYPDISDDVDGYVINASSLNNDYVTQQVNTSSISVTSTLNELSPGITYTITVRAYQDILGPPSDEVSDTTHDALPPVITWTHLTPITDLLNTQYSIQCDTASNNVNPSLIYWTIDGVKLPNTSFTLDGSNYTSSLVQYLNNKLGESVSITCSIEGVINTTIVLKAPPMSPQDVSVSQPLQYDSSISISWSSQPSSDGFIVTISPNYTIYQYDNSTTQATITGLTPNVLYTITVYAYNDLISAGVNVTTEIDIQPLPSSSSSSVDVIPTAISTTKTQTTPPLPSLSSSRTSITPVDTSTSTDDPGGSSSLPIVVGVVVGCLVLVIIIVTVVVIVIVFFVGKRRQSRGGDEPHTVVQDDPFYEEIDATHPTRSLPSDGISMQPCEPYGIHRPAPIKLAHGIEMQACQAYSSHIFSKGINGNQQH